MLTDIQATSGKFRGRLRTLLNRLGPDDQLIFYYAGHGVPGRNGNGAYLLAQDGGPGSYEEPDLNLQQLYSDIASSRVGRATIFVDACFSGRSDKDTIVFSGVAPIVVSPVLRFPGSDRLSILTAGQGHQFSNQSRERGHRLFGYHLIRLLVEGAGKLPMSELHHKLRESVLRDSRLLGPEFEQEPSLYGSGRRSLQ